VRTSGPLFVVVMSLLKVKADPVRWMPLIVVVFSWSNVEVPFPASCVIVLAEMAADAVTSCACVICKLSSGVPPPTTPEKKMSPMPDNRVKLCAPSIVLLKMISAPVALFEERLVALDSVIGSANWMGLSCVVKLPPMETEPPPNCWKAPEIFNEVPGSMVSVPELVTMSGPLEAVAMELAS